MFLLFFSFTRAATERPFIWNNMGYIDASSEIVNLSSSFIGFTVIVNAQSLRATVGYRTKVSGDYTSIENTTKLSPNTEIQIDAWDSGTARVAYAAVDENDCTGSLRVITNHSATITLTASTTTEHCVFYAPAAAHLQFNIEAASMDDRWDSLTVYHEQVNDIWYDRYETITAPSGWSAISERPWLFKFKTVRNGKESQEATVTISLKCDEALLENENEFDMSPITAPAAKHAILQKEIAIPVVGCAAPGLLLASWIFAFVRLKRKDPPMAPAEIPSTVTEENP